MIDDSILDSLIPIPEEKEIMSRIKRDLSDNGFKVTKWDSGGVFFILTRIVVRCHVELLGLARTMLNNSFVRHATGKWLLLKGQDYSKTLKEAKKTQGYVKITRGNTDGNLSILKGHMFKTEDDANGDALRYYALEDTIISSESASGEVLVEAEKAGTDYNVSEGRITASMVYLEGDTEITNASDWISSEGSDTEEEQSFRNRVLASWSELSTNTIKDKLQNAVEAIEGVLCAYIDDKHPRGQGTVDIIVTGTAGEASRELLEKVQEAVDKLKDSYEDYLAKSAEVVLQDFEFTVYVDSDANTEGVAAQAKALLEKYMKISGRELNILLHEDITYILKSNITGYKKTVFVIPNGDLILDIGKVILLGSAKITVENM